MASSNQQKTDAEKKLVGDIVKTDLYALLEVDTDATDKVLLKAYRKKALKCHPDKNPDDPKAAEAFHLLSKALEILTDTPARAAYDKIVRARRKAEERHSVLDSKRRKFKDELESRERKLQKEAQRPTPDISHAEKFQQEVQRLRKEGSRLLEEEQARMREEIKAEKASQASVGAEPPRLKLRWQAARGDMSNGGYSETTLRALLDKYGEVSELIVSRRKLGSAVVEFCQPGAAQLAYDNERGLADNPLRVTWLSGKPTSQQQRPSSGSPDPIVIGVNSQPDVLLTGFTFNSTPDSTTPKHSAGDSKSDEGFGSASTASAGSDDFESLVLRNLRQAQERKQLEKQLQEEEQDEGQ